MTAKTNASATNGNNSAHTLKREYEGHAEKRAITPTCSCGWRGRAEYRWNDYQLANVTAQESDHSRAALALAGAKS
jgi:hypothetical protein